MIAVGEVDRIIATCHTKDYLFFGRIISNGTTCWAYMVEGDNSTLQWITQDIVDMYDKHMFWLKEPNVYTWKGHTIEVTPSRDHIITFGAFRFGAFKIKDLMRLLFFASSVKEMG